MIWTDETTMNLYQNDGGKESVEKERRKVNDVKRATLPDKHNGGSVVAWTCMAASGTESVVFIDDVTAAGGSGMNS